MSDDVENRLRLARLELTPNGETEERALRAALAQVPELRAPVRPARRARLRRVRSALAARRRSRLVLVTAAGLPAAITGIVLWVSLSTGSSSPSVVVGGAGASSDRFPSETFTDWVSYGDQVSVFSVASEEGLPPRREDLERGEGYIGRAVTLRIERTIWRRKGAPFVDGTVRIIATGWVLQDGERHPFALQGGPRLEVGGRYLAPLVRAPRNGVEWTLLSAGATLPLEGDVTTATGVVGNLSLGAAARIGKSVKEIAEILAGTPPDPIAAKYFDLPPDERWQAVLREKPGG